MERTPAILTHAALIESFIGRLEKAGFRIAGIKKPILSTHVQLHPE
jgi:hypothetical protein